MAEDIQVQAKSKMEKTLEALSAELETLKAGRANPHMLDKITADYYGTPTPINQMASIASPEPTAFLTSPCGADRCHTRSS